ncbi:MAG TPA: ABC transporter permease [Opitutaceae bacterium]|nr:ABC transporter permease [Opitutaceae bacterium]
MHRLRQFFFRLGALFSKRKFEAVLAAEIRQHLEMMAEANRAEGMAPGEAQAAALRQFGGVEQIKEAYRDERTLVWLEQLARDFRIAVRSLLKAPGFTAATVVILALGIGANAALFSWIRVLRFDPLPGAADPARLVAVENFADAGNGAGEALTTSYLDFRDYRDHLKLLDLAAIGRGALAVGDERASERVWCELVSGNFFDVLGVVPAAGRFFGPEERTDAQNAHPVAVISRAFWQARYQASPAAIGSTLRVNRVPFTIIGVAPAGFCGTQPGLAYQVWVPLTMYGEVTHTGTWMLDDRNTRNFTMLARLKPGVTIDQAGGEAAALAGFMARRNVEDRGVGAAVVPLWRWHFGPQQIMLKPMTILMAASIVLLLIVCANVANLQLARATARQKEFSIRLALGAGRRRLARQLLVESFVLALAGAALGLVIAAWLGGTLPWLLPAVATPALVQPPLAGGVFGFTMLLAAAVAAAAGLAPALHAARANLNEVLKAGGRSGAAGAPSHRLRGVFVVAEVALAVVALVGAAMFLKSFQESRALAPGFAPEGQVLAQFNLSTAGYTRQQADSFCQRMTEMLGQQPGVTGASYADSPPLGFHGGNWEDLQVEGYQPAPGENMKTYRNLIGPGYFEVMKIPRVEGRDFDLRDGAGAPDVMIVSEEFVRRFIPQGGVIGRKVHGWGRWFTIVGVVKDIKIHHVAEGALPFFYIPMRQEYRPEYGLTFHVRTSGPAAETIAAVRRAAAAIDPALTLFDAQPMTEYIAGSLFGQKLAASMLSLLASVGLALAAMGLYSVMAYSVAQRTAEIGIRMALGAKPADVLTLVLRQGLGLAVAGVIIGSVIAGLLARIAAALFTTLHPADPVVYVGTALVTVVVAVLSVAVPAWRALRVNPLVALRNE